MDFLRIRELLPRVCGHGFPEAGESEYREIKIEKEIYLKVIRSRTRITWVKTLPWTMANIVLLNGFLACGFAYYFTWFEQYTMAGLAILIASLTDWLDGQMARLYQQETMIGAILDPLRDKILAGMVFFFSVTAGGLLLGAELISTVFALLLQRYVRKRGIADHIVLKGSKVLTGIQLASFCSIYALAVSVEQGWATQSTNVLIPAVAYAMALVSVCRLGAYAMHFITRKKRHPL